MANPKNKSPLLKPIEHAFKRGNYALVRRMSHQYFFQKDATAVEREEIMNFLDRIRIVPIVIYSGIGATLLTVLATYLSTR